MSVNHLLLECLSRLDEEQNLGPVKSEQKMPVKKMNKSVRKILSIPGVNYAVLMNEQNQPDDDNSDSAARLAAQGHFFGDMAKQLGTLLGARGCNFTAASGQAGHCVTFRSNKITMVVGMPAGIDFRSTEDAIRATLSRK
jgi:hypothetical protein